MEGNGHNTENENLKQKRGKETRGLKKPMKFLEKMIVKFKQGNSLRQSDVAKKSNAARSKTEYDHEMINTQIKAQLGRLWNPTNDRLQGNELINRDILTLRLETKNMYSFYLKINYSFSSGLQLKVPKLK